MAENDDVQIKFRIPRQLRDELEVAAHAAGQSVTKLITAILSTQHERLDARKPTFGILKLLESVMNQAGESALFVRAYHLNRSDEDWTTDVKSCDEALSAAIFVLKAFQPETSSVNGGPSTSLDGIYFAEAYLKAIATKKAIGPCSAGQANSLRSELTSSFKDQLTKFSKIDPDKSAHQRLVEKSQEGRK